MGTPQLNVNNTPPLRDGFGHPFKALALAFLHFLKLFRIGEVRRGKAGQFLRVLQASFQSPGAIPQTAALQLFPRSR